MPDTMSRQDQVVAMLVILDGDHRRGVVLDAGVDTDEKLPEVSGFSPAS